MRFLRDLLDGSAAKLAGYRRQYGEMSDAAKEQLSETLDEIERMKEEDGD